MFDFIKNISKKYRITQHGQKVKADYDVWEKDRRNRKVNLTKEERDYWIHRFICPRQGRGCPSCSKQPPQV